MQTMQLTAGRPAPNFTGNTVEGRPLTLSAISGPRWLAFYRFASCPFCNLFMHQVMERAPHWRAAGLNMIAVFQSPASSVAELVARYKITFPVICDPEEKLYALYGLQSGLSGVASMRNLELLMQAGRDGVLSKMPKVKPDGTFTRIPADFFIDENGIIVRANYGKLISDHVSLADVDAFAARAGAGALSPALHHGTRGTAVPPSPSNSTGVEKR